MRGSPFAGCADEITLGYPILGITDFASISGLENRLLGEPRTVDSFFQLENPGSDLMNPLQPGPAVKIRVEAQD